MFESKLEMKIHEQNLTTKSLSEMSGISEKRLVQLISNNFSKFLLSELDILSNIFNCKISDLFFHTH